MTKRVTEKTPLPLSPYDDEPRWLREIRALARQRRRFGAKHIVRVLVEPHWQVIISVFTVSGSEKTTS